MILPVWHSSLALLSIFILERVRVQIDVIAAISVGEMKQTAVKFKKTVLGNGVMSRRRLK